MPVSPISKTHVSEKYLPPEIVSDIIEGRLSDPFRWLGLRKTDKGLRIITFSPGASEAVIQKTNGERVATLDQIDAAGLFAKYLDNEILPFDYCLAFHSLDHGDWIIKDPYSFGPVLGELDEYLLAEGRHERLWTKLGAHEVCHEGTNGTAFAVWAPNARRVSVIGDFNFWDGRRHPMRRCHGSGLWEIFLPDVFSGELYKYEIIGAQGERILKSDPIGFRQEMAPGTASIVWKLSESEDRDNKAEPGDFRRRPVSIYEVHLGSWRRGEDGRFLSYEELAPLLIDYVTDMGFTHLEFLPVSEHPFSGSWGYQPIGLFAPTARFGDPDGFKNLVDRCHDAGLGVILDWVPAHFPSDAHGLVRFDGTALYEHEDPRLGFHRDWNTLIYNYGRVEVANFLRANALFWLKEYGVDALRVDAVASMLYLDYSRAEEDWIPNRFGGRENLDAIEFLRSTNREIAKLAPGAMTIAEESTAWPGVTQELDAGGLGFDFKWNMGWMHDTLDFMQKHPEWRKWHHHQMTFGITYAFSENFVLPLSHDEVVHGKGSLLNKMPGDRWQKFANLRAYFGFMWAHPGKKLLFMGGEFGQEREWNHDQSLDWHLLDNPDHAGLKALVKDLNHLYTSQPAMHEGDCDGAGFSWLEPGDVEQSVLSWERRESRGQSIIVISNFTPVVRQDYCLGVPHAGPWNEIMNTDKTRYGGSGIGNEGEIQAFDTPLHNRSHSICLTLPPLATIILRPLYEQT